MDPLYTRGFFSGHYVCVEAFTLLADDAGKKKRIRAGDFAIKHLANDSARAKRRKELKLHTCLNPVSHT